MSVFTECCFTPLEEEKNLRNPIEKKNKYIKNVSFVLQLPV